MRRTADSLMESLEFIISAHSCLFVVNQKMENKPNLFVLRDACCVLHKSLWDALRRSP